MEGAQEQRHTSTVRVVAQVPSIDGSLTPYSEFRDKFMRPNLPVLITGLMQNWRASADWVTESGTPNLGFISTHFGNSNVQVAECGTREFTDQKRLNMSVSEFIAYWLRIHANQQEGSSHSLLYLKDWHFVKEYSQYYAYTTPEFFRDDWLNLYLECYQLHLSGECGAEKDSCCSDYRFVYMGPKGTWTPLHADVFRSYSWSGNICGRKLWHLLPPSETCLIYDRNGRSTLYDIYGEISSKEFPNFHKAGWQECVQDRGDILFVPSGWYHQVTNLEDTISINHNWFNGCNLHWVWQLLLADYNETKESIEDIRSISDNFEELCERNLAANSGMNLHDFFFFIIRMTSFFLSILRHSVNKSSHWALWKNNFFDKPLEMEATLKNTFWQLVFNLDSIGTVVEGMEYAMSKQSSIVLHKEGSKRCEDGKVEYLMKGWEGLHPHSEYVKFLAEISSQCIRDVKHERVGMHMGSTLGDFKCALGCIGTEKEQYLDGNGYVDIIRGFEDILKDVAFVNVNTPKELALVIRSVISCLSQSTYHDVLREK